MTQKIIPVSDFRRQTSQVIKSISQTGEVVCLTQHGRPKVALVDYAQYEALLAKVAELGRQQESGGVGEMNLWAATGVSVAVTISSAEAQRLVNQEMVPDMGTGLGAREPNLMLRGQRALWQVPLTLSLPILGDLGEVGIIEIDAQTGAIVTDYASRQRILQHAQRLYAGATLSAE